MEKLKKERKKFLILEAMLWTVIVIDDFGFDKLNHGISGFCMLISWYLWAKFTWGIVEDNVEVISEKEVWVYSCAMPFIYVTQLVIWIVKSYEIMSQSPLFNC